MASTRSVCRGFFSGRIDADGGDSFGDRVPHGARIYRRALSRAMSAVRIPSSSGVLGHSRFVGLSTLWEPQAVAQEQG